MEICAGRYKLQFEHPQTVKFAVPLLMLAGLFMTPRHLSIPIGYFASIGWEVYAANYIDLGDGLPGLQMDWAATLATVIDSIGAVAAI